jgi:glutathione synthase/RimK-type ligase-like ATP-grasp enzyme
MSSEIAIWDHDGLAISPMPRHGPLMTSLCILGPSTAYDTLAADEIIALKALFPAVEFRNWQDAGDLSGFDIVTPLVAWGYHLTPADWAAFLDDCETKGIPLINPAPLLRWNSDKAYLFDLEVAGVPIVPTLATDALDTAALMTAADAFSTSELIVKPAQSAGSDRTYRLHARDAIPADVADAPMLIQPMMPGIADGEMSLLYFGGQFSHAIVKRAKAGDFRVQPQFGGTVSTVTPPPAAMAIAAAALIVCPVTPAYARVDLVPDGDGFALMELELIEPSLFLEHAPDGGAGLVSVLS